MVSSHGFEDCEVAKEYCDPFIDDGHRTTETGRDFNITTLMDPFDGCKWIVTSDVTGLQCCYSDKDLCEFDAYRYDEEKCRKNQTEYKVHITENNERCSLELLNVRYLDAGEYIQTTHFKRKLHLTVNRNRDWELPVGLTIPVLIGVCLSSFIGNYLKKFMEKSEQDKKVKQQKEEEEKRKLGCAIVSCLQREDKENFEIHCKQGDVMKAVKSEENNSILHLIGTQWWSGGKTRMINDCIKSTEYFTDDSLSMPLTMLTQLDQLIDKLATPENIDSRNDFGETPLHIAAKYGKDDVVKALIQHNANVNAKDKELKTPLHNAVKNNHTKTMKTLLNDQKTKVHLKDDIGMAPLHYACQEGHYENYNILKIAMKNSPKRETSNYSSSEKRNINILHVLAERSKETKDKVKVQSNLPGKIAILESIFSSVTEDLEEEAQNGTALSQNEAVMRNGTEAFHDTVTMLNETADSIHDISAYKEDDTDTNPLLDELFYASNEHDKGHMNSVIKGKTPIEIAVQTGFDEARDIFKRNGANLKTKTVINGSEPMHLLYHSVMRGDMNFSEVLLQHEPTLLDVEIESENGIKQSYLHMAVEAMNVNAVILLLKLNIDKDKRNSKSKTALELAQEEPDSWHPPLRLSTTKKIIVELERKKETEETERQREEELQQVCTKIEECKNECAQIQKDINRISAERKVYQRGHLEMLEKKKKTVEKKRKGWKKRKRILEGKEEENETEYEDERDTDPTMEKILNRVKGIIETGNSLTDGQMVKVLQMLNDQQIVKKKRRTSSIKTKS